LAAAIGAAILVTLAARHLNALRVLGRAVAPDGTEMCLVQRCNWEVEPFTTMFVYRKGSGRWQAFYYDHQDIYWRRSRVEMDTNACKAIFFRGSSKAATFDWRTQTFVLHRFENGTIYGSQWEMPQGWSPDQ
jgi:hypothetical protein